MSRFRATADGVEVQLFDTEIAILQSLGAVLQGAAEGKDDPATPRLHPVIYSKDPQASREFDRLAAKERVEVRSADRELFADGLKTAEAGVFTLSTEDAATWARVLGESRIVLAARKGLFDSGLPEGRPEDPEVALVMFIGVLQEELVGQMLAIMEDNK